MHYLPAVLFTLLCSVLGYANIWLQIPLATLVLPLVLIWLATTASSSRKAFLLGWLFAGVSYSGVLYWVTFPIMQYGGLPLIAAAPCAIALGATLGLCYALYALFIHRTYLKNKGMPFYIASGILWTGLEYFTNFILTGFPWGTLTAAFVDLPYLAQGASLFGAYGLSGILVFITATLLHPFFVEKRPTLLAASVALSTLALLLGYGYMQCKRTDIGSEKNVRVAIAQPNVDQSKKWDPIFKISTIDTYSNLSKQAVKEHPETPPEMIVWPETGLPFYMQETNQYTAEVRLLARGLKTAIIAGSPGFTLFADRTDIFNRASFINSDGKITSWYDKEHLVPFGEFLPLERYLPFKESIPYDLFFQGVGNFVAGKSQLLMKSPNLALGMLICYEAIFPELAQKRVEQGADVLINISNDAWFDGTSGPLQHFALARLRSIEQRRWLVRATNTGVSAFIDPVGRINTVLPQYIATQTSALIKPVTERTFFSLNYTAIQNIVIVLSLLIIAAGYLPTRRKRH
ncbi:MAG: apolipoprotein N-acyltransferase [Desulfovibrio sp.]